jgi:hypothetical protein
MLQITSKTNANADTYTSNYSQSKASFYPKLAGPREKLFRREICLEWRRDFLLPVPQLWIVKQLQAEMLMWMPPSEVLGAP